MPLSLLPSGSNVVAGMLDLGDEGASSARVKLVTSNKKIVRTWRKKDGVVKVKAGR